MSLLIRQAAASAVLILAATAIVGAAEGADNDVVMLTNGDSLRCTVVSEAARLITVSVGGLIITFDPSRVVAIQRNAAVQERFFDLFPDQVRLPAPPLRRPAPTPSASAWRWEAMAALGESQHFGSVESSGTFNQSGTISPLTMQFDTDALDALPAIQLRLGISPHRTGLRPVCGFQLSVANPTGEGLDMQMYGAEALAGLRWSGETGPALELLAGICYLAATCTRDIEFYDSGGVLLDKVSSSVDLSGLGLRAECAVLWRSSRLLGGLAIGLTSSQLSGTSAWDSDQGVFTGREDLEASLLGVYAVAQLGWRL